MHEDFISKTPYQAINLYKDWYKVAYKQILNTNDLVEAVGEDKYVEIYKNYWEHLDPQEVDTSNISRLLNYAQIALKYTLEEVKKAQRVRAIHSTYFSERDGTVQPQNKDEIPLNVWKALVFIIKSLIDDGSFGAAFSLECPDGLGPFGTDEEKMQIAIQAEIPDIPWPLDADNLPPTLVVLDLIEFCYRNVAKPILGDYHLHFAHHHLDFVTDEGQINFRQKVNQIFRRNGLTFTMDDKGAISRLSPPVLRPMLQSMIFQTGDAQLDAMLEVARSKFHSPDIKIRRESLEKLWDAWERLKTIEPAKDKKASITKLLQKASPEAKFRAKLDAEARKLTDIGNSFQIRHSEVNQTPLEIDDHVDYLFHRLFALIYLLLRTHAK